MSIISVIIVHVSKGGRCGIPNKLVVDRKVCFAIIVRCSNPTRESVSTIFIEQARTSRGAAAHIIEARKIHVSNRNIGGNNDILFSDEPSRIRCRILVSGDEVPPED